MNMESFMTFNVASQIFYSYPTHYEFQSNCFRDRACSQFAKGFNLILVEKTALFLYSYFTVYVIFRLHNCSSKFNWYEQG